MAESFNYDAYEDFAEAVITDAADGGHEQSQAAFDRAVESGMLVADALGAYLLEQADVASVVGL